MESGLTLRPPSLAIPVPFLAFSIGHGPKFSTPLDIPEKSLKSILQSCSGSLLDSIHLSIFLVPQITAKMSSSSVHGAGTLPVTQVRISLSLSFWTFLNGQFHLHTVSGIHPPSPALEHYSMIDPKHKWLSKQKKGTHQNQMSVRFYQMPSQIPQQDNVQVSVGTQIPLHNTLWKQQDFLKVTGWFGQQDQLITQSRDNSTYIEGWKNRVTRFL